MIGDTNLQDEIDLPECVNCGEPLPCGSDDDLCEDCEEIIGDE